MELTKSEMEYKIGWCSSKIKEQAGIIAALRRELADCRGALAEITTRMRPLLPIILAATGEKTKPKIDYGINEE